jgi:hypothetical protein
MMTRLVLVGMVAALGITIPSWPEIQGWIGALHSWTACRLEAWDASRRSEADPVASAVMAAWRLPTFEPIVPDDRASGVADELNRVSEGLDVRPEATVAKGRPYVKGTRSPATVRMRPEFPAMPAADSVEFKLIVELFHAVERPNGGAGPAEAQVSQGRRRKPIDAPLVCAFTASSATVAPVNPVTASPVKVGSRLPTSRPKFDPIEPMAEADFDVAGVLNRFGEGIELPAAGRVATRGAKPAFVPIDPARTPCASLADELNRLSDGITIAPATPGEDDSRIPISLSSRTPVPSTTANGARPSQPRPSPEVAQAMRLTRDAVHAWLKIVARPGLIQVSAR